MVAHGVARVTWARSKCKSVPDKKLLYEGARAKLFSFTAVEPEIVAGHADLANTSDNLLHAKQRMALRALNVHLQQGNVVEVLLLTDFVERSGTHWNASGSTVARNSACHPHRFKALDPDPAWLVHQVDLQQDHVASVVGPAKT